MSKKLIATTMVALALPWLASAQDAKAILDATEKAMGAANMGSMQFKGSGLNYQFGQAANPTMGWPKFNVKTYTRVVDFDAGASRQVMVRTQGENPVRGGGQQPIIGEQTQTQVLGTNQPYSVSYDIWITPFGFLKAAAANNPTVKAETVGGKKFNVVSAKVENKYTLTGYINEQNMVEKVTTVVDTPVLGDTPVEANYSDYKDFNGLKFPAKMEVKQGGYTVMDLTITDATKNVMGGVQQPKVDLNPRQIVDEQLIANGVYYLTGGTHHSVAVEFNDYVLVIESPQDASRGEAVLSEVKKLFINKPIKYLVTTHNHFDHSGGIRPFAAEGATILTYTTNKPYFDKLFAAPRTLSPDKFSASKKKAAVEAVAEKRVITDGTRTLELYHVASPHTDTMLVAYLPKEKVLVEADLLTFNPPAPGAAAAPAPAAGAAPAPPNVNAVALYDGIEKLKLDFNVGLGLHGKQFTKADLAKAAGK
jgi:glyoxylase-like metal-dependent hydrolase (beta-lactamase superfamily II)